MTHTGQAPVLRVDGLAKKFADHTLWKALTFDAHAGSMIAVSGPSGAGKTTLLNCIGLLEDFDEGSVTYGRQTFLPHSFRKSKKQRRGCLRDGIGFLFQNYGLIEQWDVSHNLQIPLRIKKQKDKSAGREQVGKVLELVGMSDSQKKMVYTLSGGEQQRIALARLLLKNPRVILADEPTSALDEVNSNIVMRVLADLAENGAVVIISTHNADIKNSCSDIIEIGK